MGSPKKAKKSPPPGPANRRFFPIAEHLLGRDGPFLNAYTRAVIHTMWAGHYRKVDIFRRFQSTQCKISQKCINQAIERNTIEDAPRSGRPRTARTPDTMKVLRSVLRQSEWKPTTLAQLRAKMAKRGKLMPLRTLRQAKKDCGYSGRRGKKKPERAFFKVNRDKRVTCAKARLRWTLPQLRRVIWLDQSECSRDGAGAVFQQRKGQGHAMVPSADKKEEKVHWFLAIGNGWKSELHTLAVRRATVRDEHGSAVHRTASTGRRPADPLRNKVLNKPNEGETWTLQRVTAACRRWLPHLRKAFAVVVDNAPAHKGLLQFLRANGVNVADHSPYSPDLNLAENAHRDIKQGPRCAGCENNEELLAALKQEWKDYDEQRFQDLYVARYKDRLKAVIDSKGFPTKY